MLLLKPIKSFWKCVEYVAPNATLLKVGVEKISILWIV